MQKEVDAMKRFTEQMTKEMNNLLRPNITREIIETGTDREQSIGSQLGYLKQGVAARKSGLANIKSSATAETHTAYPNVDLIHQNAVDIKTLAKNIGKVIEGKFLLCRTITPANQIVGIETAVEDPEGRLAVRLALYNYSTSDPMVTNYDQVLPAGCILAIKNPWFKPTASGGLILRCDNPSQVELISKKTSMKMFPTVKWRGSVPNLLPFYLNRDVWTSFPATDQEISEELKKLGNIGFIQKRFTDAIRWYNLSLDYSVDQNFRADVFSNRAASFLNLRCYHRALDDSKKVLEVKSTHVKAVFRQTKALIGLQKYQEAADFITLKMNSSEELTDNQDLQQLSHFVQDALTQLSRPGAEVEVDIMKLLSVRDKAIDFVDNIFEYTGPLVFTLLSDGKGRGLIATEDIRPGQLLMTCKAFSIANYKAEDIQNTFDWRLNLETNVCNRGPAHDALVAQIAYKIYFEPQECGPVFYNLFAGPELKSLQFDSPDSQSVSIKRIDRIVIFNAFESESDEVSLFQSAEQRPSHVFSGVWILPSFANHSCSDSNASWITYGDVMVVRAIKSINKGEEILIPYINPWAPYDRRMDVFRSHCFNCKCRLCKLDEEDEQKGSQRAQTRSQLLKQLTSLKSDLKTKPASLKPAKAILSKLVALRSGSPHLNSCLATETVQNLAAALFLFGNFMECRDLLKTIYLIEKNIGSVREALSSGVVILRCYLAVQDLTHAKQWMKVLKKDLMLAYGSLLPMKTFASTTLDDLEALGIHFFQD